MTNDSFGFSLPLIGQVAKIMICLVHQIGFEFRSLKSRSVAFCDEQKCHSRGAPAPVTFLSFSFICKCGPKLLSWHRCGVNTKSFGAPPSLFKVMETEKGRLCTTYKRIVPGRVLHKNESTGALQRDRACLKCLHETYNQHVC